MQFIYTQDTEVIVAHSGNCNRHRPFQLCMSAYRRLRLGFFFFLSSAAQLPNSPSTRFLFVFSLLMNITDCICIHVLLFHLCNC